MAPAQAHPLRIAADFSIPQEAVTQTFAIVAKRGVGKTYTGAVLTEELLKANLPVVVVDPIGVWWGLRAAADGKGQGLPIIVLGGDHGDAPLEVTSGEVIARMIAEDRISLVLDLSLFRKGEQVRFMVDFCETLYRLNRKALHIVMDEADAFAPQRPMHNEARLLGAVEDLVRRGRARGIGMTLISQRTAVLNKNVLTQVEVLVALRTIAPQDREAIDEWIKVHGTPEQRKELMDSLPSLPIGTAWFWSPGWLDVFQRVKVRKRETYDSSSTPVAGRDRVQPKLAAVDLDKLKSRISETIERAKADDPRELRRRIAELEQQAAAPSKAAAMDPHRESEIRKEAARAVHQTYAPLIEHLISDARNIALTIEALLPIKERMLSTVEALRAGRDFQEALTEPRPLSHSPAAPPIAPAGDPDAGARRQPRRLDPPSSANGKVEGGLRRMMIALAQRSQGLSAKQLGVRAGLSSSSGTFGTYLGKGRSQGWIEGSRDRLAITKGGLAALGSYDPLPTGRELREYWLDELGGGAGRMLEELAKVYPKELSADQLGERAGLSAASGTFGTYLGKLRTLELVEGTRAGLRASAELF